MKIKYYIRLALLNLRRRRSSKLNCFFIVLSLGILFLTNAIGGALNQFMDKNIYETLSGRTIHLNVFNQDPLIKDKIEKAVEGDERILELYHNPFGVTVKSNNINELVSNSGNDKTKSYGYLLLKMARQQDIQLLTNGRFIDEDETDVCLVPELFYPNHNYQIELLKNDIKFYDGNLLIGKTITVEYYARDYSKDDNSIIKTFQRSFKVVGTYDILPNQLYPYEIMVSYNDIMSAHNDLNQNNLGLSEDSNITYGIIVDKSENVEDVIATMHAAGINAKRYLTIGSISDIAKYIQVIGTILGTVILVICLLNIILSMLADVKKRDGEIGLMKAMGYKDIQVIKLISLEAIMVGIISLVITLVLSLTLVLITEHWVQQNASIYSSSFNIIIRMNVIVRMVLFSLVVPLIGSSFGIICALLITPKNALSKAEKSS